MHVARHWGLSLVAACGVVCAAAPLAMPLPAEACMARRHVKLPIAAPSVDPGHVETTSVIDQAGERILFIQDGDTVTAHVQVQYYGDAKEFSWIVPVAAEPMVGLGSDALFTALREKTRPQFELKSKVEGTCKEPPSSGAAASRARAGAPKSGAAADAGVTVVSEASVGPYETTVLKAEDAGSLRQWLTDNDYEVPARLDAVMADYVNAKAYFVAFKLQKDRSVGDLQPIALSYKAPKPGLPIRLASLSAVPDMDLYVWVLGDQRAVPENYAHVDINEARLDWLDGGSNYRQVVTEAMNDAGGKAFVTDYAGDASGVDLTSLDHVANLPTADLTRVTDPVDFIAALWQGGFFAAHDDRLYAFLARQLKKPDAYKDMDDATFFSGVGSSREGHLEIEAALRAAVPAVDTGKAIRELNETLVEPAQAIQKAFAAHPYLTQLYTTMSPDEMVEDPSFVFNSDLPKVASLHKAEAITECSGDVLRGDAPVRIRLSNGASYYVSDESAGSGTKGGKGPKIPAALRIGKCGTVGQMTWTQDYSAQVLRTLADLSRQGISLYIRTSPGQTPPDGAGVSVVLTIPIAGLLSQAANGFSCAGCAQGAAVPPPVRRGSGEGVSYALLLAGFLGYRKWLGRRR